MKKRCVLGCLIFICCLLAYQSMVVFWPTVERAIDRYIDEKGEENFNENEDLPDEVKIFKERPFSVTLLKKFKRLFGASLSSSSSSSPFDSKDVKVVLFWTSWFRKPWWVRVGGGLDLVDAGCPETRCIFTHDKSRLDDASAILFQSQRVVEEKLPPRRTQDQRWVWVHVEPPTTSLKALASFSLWQGTKQDLSHLFNWTMTYHPDSDIMEPYGALVPLDHPEDPDEGPRISINSSESSPTGLMRAYPTELSSLRPALLDTSSEAFKRHQQLLRRSPSMDELMDSAWEPNMQWDKAKTYSWWFLGNRRRRLVAWVSSHCSTFSQREDYVHQLQNYIDVDAYGDCGAFRCGSRQDHRDDRCWRQIFARKYLFYLAFENSICDGYVTEKLWRPLAYGLVPIVLGGANYSQFLPPKSYINALDYSPKELGQLLKDLQESPDYYIQYHLWRVFWRVSMRPPLCELCLKIHNDASQSIQHDIAGWWKSVGGCHNPAQWPLSPS